MESKIVVPQDGNKIGFNSNLKLDVPNNPIIPFICGDGIGIFEEQRYQSIFLPK